MRISFIGSAPLPPTRDQAGTAIMVELGNGKRFFFDFGSGCMRNLVALQVPLQDRAPLPPPTPTPARGVL